MGSLGSHDLDFERRYDDLLQEALARIPVYEAEWTDLNESDPGITLLQLFTYLVEAVMCAVVASALLLAFRTLLKRRKARKKRDRDALRVTR